MSQRTTSDILATETTVVEIDDYGRRGEGVAALADGRVHVPGALPGERVEIVPEPERDDSGRLFARLVEVLDPSPSRRDPLCEYDDICRGCHLRQATVSAEIEFKAGTVRRMVEAHAGLEIDDQPDIETIEPFPARRGDAHRIRAELTYRVGAEGGVELGLESATRANLVPMRDCPALSGAARRLVGHIGSTLDGVATPPAAHVPAARPGETPEVGIASFAVVAPTYGRGLVDIGVGGIADEEAFLAFLDRDPVESFLDALADRLPEDTGLAIHDGGTRELLAPPERVRFPLLGLQLVAGFEDWLPTTLDPTEALYEYVLEQLELEPGDRLLDVGCGIGTLSILAAPEVASVTGIDINRHSVEAAELNAVDNDVENVEFMPSGWEKALRELALGERQFDAATVNPTRAPLGERPLTYLGELGVERLVYVGPSPESAARDLGTLREKGWTIDRLGAANVDPAHYQTTLVARATRGG